MSYISFILSLYLAAVLGTAGLVKLEQPNTFNTILLRYKLVPKTAVKGICNYFPWVEIAVAALLVSGVLPLIVATGTVVLFVGFLVVKVRLVATKRNGDCGCFGAAYKEKVDLSSVLTATIMLMFSSVHWLLVAQGMTLGSPWRVAASAAFAACGLYLGWHVWRRYKRNSQCRVWGQWGCGAGKQPTPVATGTYVRTAMRR